MDTYAHINTLRFTSLQTNKLVMKCSPPLDETSSDIYFILGGLDLKLFDLDLNLVDEHSRKTKDNSIKFTTMIKTDKFAVATNSDIEIYALVCLGAGNANSNEDHNELNKSHRSYIRIKELKKFVNSHEDSILCLSKLTEAMFASGSSNGHLIIWQSDTLIRLLELRPFDELNHESKRLALTSITSFRCLLEVNFLLGLK